MCAVRCSAAHNLCTRAFKYRTLIPSSRITSSLLTSLTYNRSPRRASTLHSVRTLLYTQSERSGNVPTSVRVQSQQLKHHPHLNGICCSFARAIGANGCAFGRHSHDFPLHRCASDGRLENISVRATRVDARAHTVHDARPVCRRRGRRRRQEEGPQGLAQDLRPGEG